MGRNEKPPTGSVSVDAAKWAKIDRDYQIAAFTANTALIKQWGNEPMAGPAEKPVPTK